MALELIGAIALGFGAAGLVLLLIRLSRGRLPRSLVPFSAAVAMIGFAVWSDYSWAERTQGALPESFVVTSSFETRSGYRPWTYLLPVTEHFSAVDTAAIARNAAHPDIALVDVWLLTRRMPVGRLAQFVDCGEGRRAQVLSASDFDDPETDERLKWVPLDASNPLFAVACEGPAAERA